METNFKSNKLKGRIVEKFDSVSNFSEAIGKNKSAVSLLLNGKKRLTREDIILFCKVLDIKNDEIADYFFTN